MSMIRLAGACLALLVLSWAVGPGEAAGQVVIEERVELTTPDTSTTAPGEKASSTENPPFVYVWVRPIRGFTASPFSSPNNEDVPPGAYTDLPDPVVTVTGTRADSSAFTLDLDRSRFMQAGIDSVAWDTGCATGDQDLAVTRYDRAAESDTSEGGDPSVLDGDWVALGAVQRAEVTAPVAEEHWTGRADTTGLLTTTLNIGPVTFQTSDPGLIDPSFQFYGTRKWTLYSFGRQRAFNYPFCTGDPVYATRVAIHASRPPVIRTELSDFGFSTVVKQGGPPRPVIASVTYPDGREGVPEITGETPVRVQLDETAEEFGDLQWEDGSPAPTVVPFSAVDGSDSKIFYKPQESKNHEVAVDPVRAQIEIEPVPDSVKVQKEPDRFTIGGYDLSLSIEADTLEWGETTTVDVDPLYPDGDTVRVGQVGGNVFLHELLWYGFRKEIASSKAGLQKNANGDEDPAGTSAPKEFGVLDCPVRTPSAQVVLPDTSGSEEFEYFESGCDEYERFLMLNLPQAMASRDTIGLVTDSTTLRPKPGEPVQVTVVAQSDFDGIYSSGAEDQVIVVSSRPDTVLLGETRYYQAVEANGSLELEAVPTDGCEAPSLDGGKANATFTVEPETGDSLGVYYDTDRWGCVNEDGTVQNGGLPDGLIRITGRYWQPDTRYAVTLKATAGAKTGTETIHVAKPAALDDPDADRTLDTYTDATGTEFDLDSLVTRYAGRYGVPPQFVKGIIEQEACGRGEGSSTGKKASYRYEPGKDLRFRLDNSYSRPEARALMEDNRYWISSASDEGTPSIPTNHDICVSQSNIGDEYPGFNGTLNEIFKGESIKEKRGYDRYSNKLDTEIKNALDEKPNREEAEELAYQRTATWVADSLDGVGIRNIPKQTRQMASYGPMQLMYVDGIHSGIYPEDSDHLPETLNAEVDTSMKYELEFFIRAKFSIVKEDFGDTHNWPAGWNETFRRAANVYHGDDTEEGPYGGDVWRWAEDYNPQLRPSSPSSKTLQSVETRN